MHPTGENALSMKRRFVECNVSDAAVGVEQDEVGLSREGSNGFQGGRQSFAIPVGGDAQDVAVNRTDGEVYARTSRDGRAIYIAMMPDGTRTAWLVRTVLPHVFAQRNLSRSCW